MSRKKERDSEHCAIVPSTFPLWEACVFIQGMSARFEESKPSNCSSSRNGKRINGIHSCGQNGMLLIPPNFAT